MNPEDGSVQSRRFLEKVTQIVRDNFTNEQFSVALLADQYGSSRSQLYKRIKKLTGKSANQFIREVRLEEAYEMLRRDEASVSEIAFQVGFNSPAYFATCFKDRYGYPPIEAKYHNVAEMEQIVPSNSSFKKKNILIIALSALAISLGIIISGTRKVPDPGEIATIAVLPFDDLSSEGDYEWFCNGITLDISDQLSKLNHLQPISKTTTEHIKNTPKTISEFARELGISYFLEGSVRKYEEDIIVTVELVDAEDNRLWSEVYNNKFKEVFTIQHKIAAKIVDLLKVTLSPKEKSLLATIPTKNMEAYKQVLRGRHLLGGYEIENFIAAIDHFEKALLLDPEYSDAYAYIAYAQLTQFFWSDRGDSASLTLSKKNVERALLFNPNSSNAYTTQAIFYRLEGKYERAAENYEKALSIDPNNALTHLEYARYYLHKVPSDLKNFLKHAQIAKVLDPLSTQIRVATFYALLRNQKIEEAEKWYEEMVPLLSPEEKLWAKAEIAIDKFKDRRKELDVYLEALSRDSLNTDLLQRIARIYDTTFNDDQMAVRYLAKAYNIDKHALYFYLSLLCENGDFERAWEIIQSKEFKTYRSRQDQLPFLFYYYWHKKDFQKALEISNDSLMQTLYTERAMIRARLGMQEELNLILKYKPLTFSDKATIYAVLGLRDSMYHYLHKPVININVNSRHALDPYRHETRFQDFQRKYFIPVIGE